MKTQKYNCLCVYTQIRLCPFHLAVRAAAAGETIKGKEAQAKHNTVTYSYPLLT